jgi:hypothetical protein
MLASQTAAQTANGRVRLDPAQVPQSIAAQIECGTDPHDVSRRPFAGGFVFAWKCASNHANWIEALVFAESADGAGARLLRFPRPGGAEPSEELANIRWFPATRELTELFVDPEDDKVCRTRSPLAPHRHPADAAARALARDAGLRGEGRVADGGGREVVSISAL